MSSPTATKPMTAEKFFDFVHLPENDNRWFELVRGEVIELPPPKKMHGVVCVKVAAALEWYVNEKGVGYVASNDSGVILERDPDTVRGPDVAYYDDSNTFSELHPKYGEVPPRIAVEVLSPDDRASKVMRKITDYLSSGVAEVWVIDPEERTVTTHRPDRPQTLLNEKQEITSEDILPGFRLPVSRLFRLAAERPG